MVRRVYIGLCFCTFGCGDPLEREFERLEEGGAAAEEAMMVLALSEEPLTEPLIAALGDERYSTRARSRVADVLYRMYARNGDPRILAALEGQAHSDDREIRLHITRVIGLLGEEEQTGLIVDLLERERDDAIRRELLVALENVLGVFRGGRYLVFEFAALAAAERERLSRILQRMAANDMSDSLVTSANDWRERLAQNRLEAARRSLLQADLDAAEGFLRAAAKIAPESKVVNRHLGSFYLASGDSARALDHLRRHGLLVVVPQLKAEPRIDGEMDERAWESAAHLTEFQQLPRSQRFRKARVRSEVLLGYRDDDLFIGVVAHQDEEPIARATEHDGSVGDDDCFELFIDVDLDQRSYHQIIVNSIPALADFYNDGSTRHGTPDWNGAIDVASVSEKDRWSVELTLSARDLGGKIPEEGTLWGFNAARYHVASDEYGQWLPTPNSAHRPDHFGFLLFE